MYFPSYIYFNNTFILKLKIDWTIYFLTYLNKCVSWPAVKASFTANISKYSCYNPVKRGLFFKVLSLLQFLNYLYIAVRFLERFSVYRRIAALIAIDALTSDFRGVGHHSVEGLSSSGQVSAHIWLRRTCTLWEACDSMHTYAHAHVHVITAIGGYMAVVPQ